MRSQLATKEAALDRPQNEIEALQSKIESLSTLRKQTMGVHHHMQRYFATTQKTFPMNLYPGYFFSSREILSAQVMRICRSARHGETSRRTHPPCGISDFRSQRHAPQISPPPPPLAFVPLPGAQRGPTIRGPSPPSLRSGGPPNRVLSGLHTKASFVLFLTWQVLLLF